MSHRLNPNKFKASGTSPTKIEATYKYRNKFQEDFRNGLFEADESDLKNLDLESWIPLVKKDINEAKQKIRKQADSLANYMTDEEITEFERSVAEMISDAYRIEMPKVCPNLIENQEILANYRQENKIKYSRNLTLFMEAADKNKLIKQILMIQEDIRDVQRRNNQLRNHIELLKKTKDQAILSKAGMIAQINSAETSSPCKSLNNSSESD